MAEHKIGAGKMYLFIDTSGVGTTYDTVVCGKTLSVEDSVGEIDASSQCGPDIQPGILSLSRSFEGQHLADPLTGKVSGAELRQVLYAKTKIAYKISAEVPVTGDVVETGFATITSLSSSYSDTEVGTFSLTFKPTGTPTLVTTI